ncbi:MAG: pteridine reductase [Pseudomonadota bacterium]
MKEQRVALVTGAGKRVGSTIIRTLHRNGMRVLIHYRSAKTDAERLCNELNAERKQSAAIFQADLANFDARALIKETIAIFDRLDLLVNNASTFYPTRLGEISMENWHDLFSVNAQAPLFLAQAAMPYLQQTQGNIINMIDIHAQRPIKNMSVYCMAKAASSTMIKALARELAPRIRVNGIAPGMIMWPDEDDMPEKAKQSIIKRIALQRSGTPQHIADTILFLVNNDYITGEIITVDGGRLLTV